MTRGAVLFAHNNGITDYFKMAAYTASRIERFLNIPVTVITDDKSVTCSYPFDKVMYKTPDTSNSRNKSKWINKGRYEVFEMSPYDDTIIIDTDYLINSRNLLRVFDLPSDFVSFRNCKYLMEDQEPERIGKNGFETMWATVMRFTKTQRTADIFKMIKMVQDNYNHYSELHNFAPYMYRNDYALTIALRTANGHVEKYDDYIPWNLLHAGIKTKVTRLSDTEYNLERHDNQQRLRTITLKDCDFHMLDKDNFMEIAI
jgi:hypothetical protein